MALKIPWRDYSPDGWKYALCKQPSLLPSRPRQLPDILTIYVAYLCTVQDDARVLGLEKGLINPHLSVCQTVSFCKPN